MYHYRKGAGAERELIKMFSERGFMVVRAAGSGVNSLSPDLLAFKSSAHYAIESKAWENDRLAIKRDQFENLKKWTETAGITTFIAWRRNRERWVFIPLSVFKEAKESYTIGWEDAKLIGRDIADL